MNDFVRYCCILIVHRRTCNVIHKEKMRMQCRKVHCQAKRSVEIESRGACAEEKPCDMKRRFGTMAYFYILGLSSDVNDMTDPQTPQILDANSFHHESALNRISRDVLVSQL